MVNYKGKEDEINIKNHLMGDKYAAAYSKGLKMLTAKKLNISHNRLNPLGSLSIVNGINKGV